MAPLAITLMWAINSMRMFVLFMVGYWGTRVLGYSIGDQLLLQLFHSHLGWLFYALGISVLYHIGENWVFAPVFGSFKTLSKIRV